MAQEGVENWDDDFPHSHPPTVANLGLSVSLSVGHRSAPRDT